MGYSCLVVGLGIDVILDFGFLTPDSASCILATSFHIKNNNQSSLTLLVNNAKVAVTPGSAFEPSGEHHVRIADCVD